MHDIYGREIKVGDEIIIRYVVTAIQPGSDYCNLSAQSLAGRKPDGCKEYFTGNSAVCERVANNGGCLPKT